MLLNRSRPPAFYASPEQVFSIRQIDWARGRISTSGPNIGCITISAGILRGPVEDDEDLSDLEQQALSAADFAAVMEHLRRTGQESA